jgi:hypothetical protein
MLGCEFLIVHETSAARQKERNFCGNRYSALWTPEVKAGDGVATQVMYGKSGAVDRRSSGHCPTTLATGTLRTCQVFVEIGEKKASQSHLPPPNPPPPVRFPP